MGQGSKRLARRRSEQRWTNTAIVLAWLGIGLRLLIAGNSVGSNDAQLWFYYATYLTEHGLHATYRDIGWFNHPPLMGYVAMGALWLDQQLPVSFANIVKIPSIAAEGLVVYLLWRAWRPRGKMAVAAVALYSFNPATVLVSAYHGNTDCLVAGLAALAAVLVHEKRSPFWAGLALGAAINVKLIPGLLVPVLAAYHWPSYKRLLRFTGGLALAALPFTLVLPVSEAFYRNALAYNSVLNLWGLGEFYIRTWTLPSTQAFIGRYIMPAGRYAILLSAVGIGAWQVVRPRLNALEATALCLSAFLIFAPGFGIQYIVYPVPFLFLLSLGWGARYAVLAGVFAGIIYYTFWTGTWPPYSEFNNLFHMPSELFGLLAWTTLIAFAAHVIQHPAGALPRRRIGVRG